MNEQASAITNTESATLFQQLKFTLKRMLLTAPYWTDLPQTFKFFMATRQNYLGRSPIAWFRFKKLFFGIRPMDWYIMQSIIIEEEYTSLKLLFPEKAPEVVIDAGANVGLFGIYALSLWPDIKIFSIEASPETYLILKKNQEKNSAFAWRAYQYALCDQDGEVSFETEGFSMGWHISKDKSLMQVPAIRLDSFINNELPKESRISLLKIDIEGAEESVLRSNPDILDRVDALLIEVHPYMCDEKVVNDTLKNKFPHVYDVTMPNSNYPILLATRWPLPGDKFKAI